MNPLRQISHAVAVMLLCIMAACSVDQQPPTLTVSIEPQRYLLEQIAGSRWQVNTLLDKNADPESFDPTMDVMKSVMRSRAYFRAGNMAFEDVVVNRLSENNPEMIIVDTSKNIDPIYGTHDHGSGDDHGHGDADPHTWCSVRNARAMAAEMYRAMKVIDPEHADVYTDNYRRLDHRLDSIDQAIIAGLSSSHGASFLMWHPALSYFARDYDLRQLSLGADGKELSARGLKEKIDQAENLDARLFVMQPDTDNSRTTEIAAQGGMNVIKVNLNSYNWLDDLQRVAAAVASTSRQ